jgi:rhamnogalacturonyl hydrolase YesR/lysophospholipase L1-like esterase
MRYFLLLLILFSCANLLNAQIAPEADYLNETKTALAEKWPRNKTVHLVFHGHSVPCGYFNTPNVQTLKAYPYLTLEAVKKIYPYAVVNVITTSIGGENAEQGNLRFEKDVLTHRPDVLFIDYALNDRSIGLERAGKAWKSMIRTAQALNIKVILLTPTPDLTENISDDNAPLEKHSRQIREMAKIYQVGLVDVYAAFKEKKRNGEDLAPYMSQSNHPNEKGHRIVRNLLVNYLADAENRDRYLASEVREIITKTLNRQLLRFENQVMQESQWPDSHTYWAWTNATLYVGIAEWAKLSGDQTYWDFLLTIGKKNQWKPGPNIYFADDICVIQVYQQLYEYYRDEAMLRPSVEALAQIIENPKTGSLSYYAKDSHARWCWCDALFMAPTALARVGKSLGNRSYFDFLDREFWTTCDSLYCSQEKLFFRDTRYKTMQEKNGEKIFWGRGNGWVIGGLTVILDHLPEDYPSRPRFIHLYREMMERIAGLQDAQGFWHPSLLDISAYPTPETSASGFFTYGLLWGINRGYLDRETYLPKAQKAWEALCTAVQEDGTLGFVQTIGSDPKTVSAGDTDVYGVGAFLLAGCEIYKLKINNK